MAKTPSTAERLEDENLVKLTVDEREQLEAELNAEFDAADKAGDPDAMSTALEGLNKLDLFERLAEAVSNSAPSDDEEEDEEKEEDEKSDAKDAKDEKSDAEAEGKTETDAPATETSEDAEKTETADAADADTTETTEESEAQAMAASVVTNPGQELKPAEEETPKGLVASAYAGADVRGYKVGEKFSDLEDIAKAMTNQINARAGMAGDGTRAVVASIRAEFPDDRDLTSDPIANGYKIDAVMGEQAIVASGGFCAPLPTNYDIYGVGSTVRPIRDSLPSFGASRGGIRYMAAPVLGSYTNAISVWTAANDANPTNPAKKPVLKVNCIGEQSATTDAITLSLEFGNLMARAFPELVQRHNQLALIEHARVAEKTLLSKISALSSKVTVPHTLGVTRDTLSAFTRAVAAYRNRHRIPRGVQLRAIFPDWTRDIIREDIASNMAMGAKDIAITDADVDAWFRNRGVTVTWHIDDTFAAQGAGVLNDFPSAIKFWLFAEGSLLFLDGGTLDLGIIRDSDLVSTNDYMTFVESFEGVAKVGLEVLEVTLDAKVGLPAAVTP